MRTNAVSKTQKSKVVARAAIHSGIRAPEIRFRRISQQRIKRVVNRLIEQLDPQKIVLFGSYAYGKPNVDSDVDMLIIMESDERPTMRITRVLGVLHGVKDFPMDILVRTPQEIIERLAINDFFMREILDRGKVLYEREPA